MALDPFDPPDLDIRRAERLRVMKTIFEASGGSEFTVVPGFLLAQELGLSERDMAEICRYLAGEGLIEETFTSGHIAPEQIRITHQGIREMEESLTVPQKPTEHFPPAVSVINIHGSVIGSPIQSGSPGARLDATIGNLDLDEITDFLDHYEIREDDLELSPEHAAEIRSEIATVRAQAESPRPKVGVIRESLLSIQRILEGAGGGVAGVYLLEALKQLNF